ncbi:MAG: hypothetical protein ACPF9U_05050 [Flavobacteriaceae bacterium]
MRKLFYYIIMLPLLTIAQQTPSSAGKFLGEGELSGNPYTFGSSSSVDVVLKSVEAYNSNDVETELSYYDSTYVSNYGDGHRDWHNKMKSLNMKPWALIPVKLVGTDDELVLTWSVEDREWKNGSTQKQNLMEVFSVNPEGKINGFSQWRQNYPSNEFGLSSGGKFYGSPENEYRGRPLVFSNRGEVKVLEKLIKDYNKMDAAACAEAFADSFVFSTSEGEEMTVTKDMWPEVFAPYTSVNWVPYSIVPLKIDDTDPTSGAIVYSKETRTMKDGTLWEKELMEIFYFDLEGKISGGTQFAKDLKASE